MGKYEPLTEFLRKQRTDRVSVTFSEIERVVGFKLPRSATEHRAWWSNNPSNSVMTKAWLEAGFQSEAVDMEGRKLVFQKVAQAAKLPKLRRAGTGQHPLIGCMAGTVWIASDTDLTRPAMPEWGEVAYGDKTWDDFK